MFFSGKPVFDCFISILLDSEEAYGPVAMTEDKPEECLFPDVVQLYVVEYGSQSFTAVSLSKAAALEPLS